MISILVAVFAGYLAVAPVAQARIEDPNSAAERACGQSLTPAEIQAFRQRGAVLPPVVRLRAVEGTIFQEICTYAVIEGTAEEAMALFADFDGQDDWAPGVNSSCVQQWVAPNVAIVDFQYSVVPGILSVPYRLDEVMARYRDSSGHDAYRLDWRKNRASSGALRTVQGKGRFESFGSHAIWEYHNLIVPNDRVRRILEENFGDQIVPRAVAKQVETVGEFKERLQQIREGGSFVERARERLGGSGRVTLDTLLANLRTRLAGGYPQNGDRPTCR